MRGDASSEGASAGEENACTCAIPRHFLGLDIEILQKNRETWGKEIGTTIKHLIDDIEASVNSSCQSFHFTKEIFVPIAMGISLHDLGIKVNFYHINDIFMGPKKLKRDKVVEFSRKRQLSRKTRCSKSIS